MGVLFTGPQLEYELIRDEWLASVGELASRGVFVGGTAVTEFESAFAAYCGTAGAAGVGNGTDALFLTLKALGIGEGDEVVTAANTFVATVEAIHHAGATPVLVDCEADSYLIDAEQAIAAITERTKAIVVVHLYGQMVDEEALLTLARSRGIAIIEDSAQAAGARLRGRPAGSLGDAGCFSFYPDKNLGALGDGGAVVSGNSALLTEIRKLRNHGGETRYVHELPGFNSRLDAIQALALSLKLRRLDEWSSYRREIAGMYAKHLEGADDIVLPSHRGEESHVFHLYVIRVPADARDSIRKALQKKGILTAVQYPRPIHHLPAFRHLNRPEGGFPVAEHCAERILSLPMHIGMNEETVAFVADTLKEALATSSPRTTVNVGRGNRNDESGQEAHRA